MTRKYSFRTINQHRQVCIHHLHVAIHAACNLQHLGCRHLRLFLGKLVQPLQGILDVVPPK